MKRSSHSVKNCELVRKIRIVNDNFHHKFDDNWMIIRILVNGTYDCLFKKIDNTFVVRKIGRSMCEIYKTSLSVLDDRKLNWVIQKIFQSLSSDFVSLVDLDWNERDI